MVGWCSIRTFNDPWETMVFTIKYRGWFCWENLHRKPMGFYHQIQGLVLLGKSTPETHGFLPSNTGVGFVGKIYTGNPWIFTMKYSIKGLVLLGKSTPETHGFYHQIDQGFPVKMFPSSNSMKKRRDLSQMDIEKNIHLWWKNICQ